jgi:hypothetical protein
MLEWCNLWIFDFNVGNKSVNDPTSEQWQKLAADDGGRKTQQPTIGRRAANASSGWKQQELGCAFRVVFSSGRAVSLYQWL